MSESGAVPLCRRTYRGAASFEVTASKGWLAHTSFTDSH
jgi:hypothetical protein